MPLIKAISDTHNLHYLLNSVDLECDILIHCGDSGTKGNYTEVKTFLDWFVKQPAKYKIYVPGNHDKSAKTHPDLIQIAFDYGIHTGIYDPAYSAHGHFWVTHIMGLQICGGTFVPSFEKGTHKLRHSPSVLREAWEDIPNDIDLLVTHAPPAGILSNNLEGDDCGCPELANKVKSLHIRHHIFGHIHEHGGESVTMYGTDFHNVACMDRSYALVREATTLNIEVE